MLLTVEHSGVYNSVAPLLSIFGLNNLFKSLMGKENEKWLKVKKKKLDS